MRWVFSNAGSVWLSSLTGGCAVLPECAWKWDRGIIRVSISTHPAHSHISQSLLTCCFRRLSWESFLRLVTLNQDNWNTIEKNYLSGTAQNKRILNTQLTYICVWLYCIIPQNWIYNKETYYSKTFYHFHFFPCLCHKSVDSLNCKYEKGSIWLHFT